MCSLNSRRSILQPIMIPEFGYPPLSPSDPGYPSPAESDTVQTPFVEHPYLPAYFDHLDQRGDGLGNGHGHAHSHNTESKHVHESRVSGNLPHLPQLFSRSSTLDTPLYRDSSPLPRLTPAFDYESSPMEVDPFVSPFSSYNIESQPTQSHDQSTVHVVSSSLQNLEKSSSRPASIPQSTVDCALNLKARLYSSRFPVEHKLNPYFLRAYELGDELGSGGHGFVITAHHRIEGLEVAVKFIIKEKIPEHGWMEDETIGRLPTEVMLLSFIDHENVVRCLDLFEDSLYFYLVQELHGSPWPKAERNRPTKHIPATSSATLMTPSTPSLSPSASNDSLADFEPATPPPSSALYMHPQIQLSNNAHEQRHEPHQLQPSHSCTTTATRPDFSRRPSHDLFECIEQSEHRCLSENQARCVFAQVVEAIYYLDSQGVTHRDIKDENLVINADLKVKLIDFGSAVLVDTNEPRPYYSLFYGTAAYASSEILRKQPYQAAPAEIWTLGVLLSYLLTGMSPFPTMKDAIDGRIVLTDCPGTRLSRTSLNLMRRCLDPNPKTRCTIGEVRVHRWLTSHKAEWVQMGVRET